MATKRQIGAGNALMMAIGAAIGLVVGICRITPAVGAAVVGIVLGTAVARGALSDKLKGSKMKLSPGTERFLLTAHSSQLIAQS